MKKLFFADYIAIFVFSINLIPPLKNVVTNVTLMSLIFLWVIMSLPKIIKYKGAALIWILVLFFWLILGSSILLINGNINVLKNYIFELVNFVFPFLVFCIRYTYIMNNSRLLTNIITTIIVISNILNIYINHFMYKNIFNRTTDSYTIVYITVIFALITLYKIISPKLMKNKKQLITEWLILIICVVNILTSGYTIANIVLIIGMGILLINRYHLAHPIFTTFVWVIFCAISFIYLDNIFELLLRNVQNPIYYERIYDVYIYLNGNSNYSTMTARLGTYIKSINAFMEHPLTGSIWCLNPSDSIYTVVGYHSTILDNFGLFGVIGGVFTISVIYYPFIWVLHRITEHRMFIFVIILTFSLIIIINNQIPGIGVITYFYLPMITIGKYHKYQKSMS